MSSGRADRSDGAIQPGWLADSVVGARDRGPLDLSAVIGDGPAAVLVVDLVTRAIVHANPVAQQLAPDIVLPVPVDRWSDAAELRDLSGAELSETDHPLSRAARAEQVSGQAVSAARRSELGSRREPLWVVGVPMSGAPVLERHALVVLLPLRSASARGLVSEAHPVRRAGASAPEGGLSDRAVLATGLSFTVADARAEDEPLVWVNPAFTTTTGYTFEEVVGRNCRFLQGPDTDRGQVAGLRRALGDGEAITTTLLNYRKDGRAFWNQVDISPVRDADGELTHFVGIQTDVTNRVDADRARADALEAEQIARGVAESAQGRLRFLIEALNRLSGTLDVDEAHRRLLDLVLPDLADWVLVVRQTESGEMEVAGAAHRDPSVRPLLDELVEELPAALQPGSIEELFLRGEAVRRVSDLDRSESLDERSAYLEDLRLAERAAGLGARSSMFVALPGRGLLDEVMVLVRGPERPQFTDEDLEVGLDLGRRVGLILDNARLFGVQARIAETLQRSLLTDVPTVEGIAVAARYQASAVGAEVGGDFYDVLALPDHHTGFVVGDVSGHDLFAAAAMGHLKGLLRACVFEHSASPAVVLERVDDMIVGLGMPTIATALYAHLRPVGDAWELTWANAGHPPPVVRHHDGRLDVLTPASGSAEILLGLASGARTHNTRRLAPGSTVIAFTDGLVERRGEGLDDGYDRLLRELADGPDDVEELCDHVLERLAKGHVDDDIALVAICLGDPPDPQVDTARAGQ